MNTKKASQYIQTNRMSSCSIHVSLSLPSVPSFFLSGEQQQQQQQKNCVEEEKSIKIRLNFIHRMYAEYWERE